MHFGSEDICSANNCRRDVEDQNVFGNLIFLAGRQASGRSFRGDFSGWEANRSQNLAIEIVADSVIDNMIDVEFCSNWVASELKLISEVVSDEIVASVAP